MRHRDGGLLAQISAAHLVSHFHIMTIPALIPLLPAGLGISYIDIGIALGVFNIITALVQTPLGYAVDRFGPRKILLAGLALGSISFAVMALFPSYPVLLVIMAMAGIANGVYHPADYSLLSRSIDQKNMGRAFSIHTFSGFLGGALAPLSLIAIARFHSISAALMLSFLIGALVFAVILFSPVTKEAGQITGKPKAEGTKTPALPRSLYGKIVILTVFFLLLSLSTGSLEKFLTSALTQGFSVGLISANLALSSFLFASAFGVLAGGYLADRTSKHGLVGAVVFGIAALLIFSVILIPMPDTALIIVLGAAGFLSGSIAPSRDMLVRASAPAGSEGRVFGIVSTGFNIGGVAGPLLYGFFLENGMPRNIIWASGLFMLATCLIALWQEYQVKRAVLPAA